MKKQCLDICDFCGIIGIISFSKKQIKTQKRSWMQLNIDRARSWCKVYVYAKGFNLSLYVWRIDLTNCLNILSRWKMATLSIPWSREATRMLFCCYRRKRLCMVRLLALRTCWALKVGNLLGKNTLYMFL